MFHGVEMKVVKMPLVIVFVLQRVLPITRLPDAAAFFAPSCVADLLFAAPCGQPFFREFFLDPAPALWVAVRRMAIKVNEEFLKCDDVPRNTVRVGLPSSRANAGRSRQAEPDLR